MDRTKVKAATPIKTPTTDITVMIEINLDDFFDFRYLLAMKNSYDMATLECEASASPFSLLVAELPSRPISGISATKFLLASLNWANPIAQPTDELITINYASGLI
jgi:hypothetical protein